MSGLVREVPEPSKHQVMGWALAAGPGEAGPPHSQMHLPFPHLYPHTLLFFTVISLTNRSLAVAALTSFLCPSESYSLDLHGHVYTTYILACLDI